MASRGIDLSDHVSVVLTHEKVHDADFIYVMTKSHRDVVLKTVPSAEDRVRLLLDGRDIHDPIGGSEDAYERCARMAEEGLRTRLQEVLL